ncbi:hypothetical protein GGR53DRAFT_322938 [Hypoxylon sp. FL1150]|nr:hypothetical protein GGR53DRAFT_322938 [Hypoxylon sp. FL1150]
MEKRLPPWSHGDESYQESFGTNKHLWGKTPAMDLLQLHRNEGVNYGNDITVLFATSGDLRNVVKTIQSLPDEFNHALTVTINDREPSTTARNAILLLLILSTLDLQEAIQINIEPLVDALIHVWYSAMITGDILSRLQSKVKPLIEEACQLTADRDPDDIVGKRWVFSMGATLCLNLRKAEWAHVLSLLDIPEHLTAESARRIRHATVLAPERADYRDRWYFKDATPSMRIAKERFREDGLVLPFGHPRHGFNIPNPTIYQAAESWPLTDQADPLAGWIDSEVRAAPWKASADLYGKLYIYLRGVLSAFIRKISTGKVHFQLFNVPGKDLEPCMTPSTCDRIETFPFSVPPRAVHLTLRRLSNLLKSRQQNPHATIVVMHPEMQRQIPPLVNQITSRRNEAITIFITSCHGADAYRLGDAKGLLRVNVDTLFKLFRGHDIFEPIRWDLNLAIKNENTIRDPWPTQLKLSRNSPGARVEYAYALASPFDGLLRCVEWKRVHPFPGFRQFLREAPT